MEGRLAGIDHARLTDRARAAARAFVDFVLPRVCVVCKGAIGSGSDAMVCGRCWSRLSVLPSPTCLRCGHPTGGEKCGWCQLLPSYVRAARSACWAAPGVGLDVIHALKYGGWHAVGREMALRMARLPWPIDVVEERAALVPVPLSGKRLRERGYNQAEILANALAGRWRVPVRTDLLHRVRHTQSQTRLTPGDRLRNVSGAFCAPASARSALRGAHILLVDDVVTTAATLNACAAALCAGGARIVSYVTFGRAPAAGDRVSGITKWP